MYEMFLLNNVLMFEKIDKADTAKISLNIQVAIGIYLVFPKVFFLNMSDIQSKHINKQNRKLFDDYIRKCMVNRKLKRSKSKEKAKNNDKKLTKPFNN